MLLDARCLLPLELGLVFVLRSKMFFSASRKQQTLGPPLQAGRKSRECGVETLFPPISGVGRKTGSSCSPEGSGIFVGTIGIVTAWLESYGICSLPQTHKVSHYDFHFRDIESEAKRKW